MIPGSKNLCNPRISPPLTVVFCEVANQKEMLWVYMRKSSSHSNSVERVSRGQYNFYSYIVLRPYVSIDIDSIFLRKEQKIPEGNNQFFSKGER